MKTLIVVGLILAIGYLFTRPVFSTRLSFLGIRYLFFSGAEFLLVGYLIGPRGFNLIPPPIVDSLSPILHLGLGWAGLMFGLQFSWKRLRIYPRERYVLSFVQALVTTAFVSLGTWLLIPVLFPEASASGALRVALAVGICAGPTAPSSIHYFSRVFKIRGRVNRLLKFIVGVDGIPAVFLVGLFAAFFRSGSVGLGEGLPGWKWLVLSTAIGVLLGAALTALVELEFSRSELLIFVLGLVAVASGLAQALELSAVYMSFCMGVTTANLAWHREEVHKLTAHAEKPLYLAFLVLAGTVLTLDDPRVFTLAVLLVALRMTGKLLGNLWWRRASSEPVARSPLLGLTLISQGAFAVVLAVDFSYLLALNGAYADWIQLVISALLVSVLMTEVMSPLLILGLVPRWHKQRQQEA